MVHFHVNPTLNLLCPNTELVPLKHQHCCTHYSGSCLRNRFGWKVYSRPKMHSTVLWDFQHSVWLIPGFRFLTALLTLLPLRNIAEKCVLEQNVWKTSASETDATRRTQEMRQTWRSRRLSGLSSTFRPHVSKHWEHVCVCIPAARRHFWVHMFAVKVKL